jgi:NDP-sugar pyrophosphorylase family protein
LGKLTATIPKPLVEVKGRPYLEHQLELLKRNGISEVLLLTGYLGDQIEAKLGTGEPLGLVLRYAREPAPIGTGGALSLSREQLPEVFFLIYGDSYLDIDYQSAYRAFNHLRVGGPFGLMLVAGLDGDTDSAGNVKLDQTGTRVTSYEKGHGGDHDHIDAGVLVLTREIVSWLPAGEPSSLETEVYPRLAREGRLLAFRAKERFYDIGTPERLAAFERKLS